MDKDFYDNYISSIFGEIHALDMKEYEAVNSFFEQYFRLFLPANTDSHICDVGCGAGFFLYYLKTKGYENIYGVDVSPQQIDQCRKMGLNNVVLDDSADYLRKNPDRFDAIFCSNVLEHLPDEKILELLRAMYVSLKRGGTVYLIVPNASPTFGNFILYIDFTHKRLFTPISLKQVLSIAGFRQAEVREIAPRGKSLTGTIRNYLFRFFSIFYTLSFMVHFGHEGYRRFRPIYYSPAIIGIAKKQ